MQEITPLLTFILGLCVGVLCVCGAVSMYVIYGSDDGICRSALYGFVSTIL